MKRIKTRLVSRGYSILEMLMTMLVLVLVIMALLPAITNRKHPRQLFSFMKSHGVFYCTKENCTFNPPEGANELLILAVGGGGGGAGTKCGDKTEEIRGGKDDVEGTRKYVPGRALYIEASSAGGGSSNGYCEKYPGNYDHYTHSKNCVTDDTCIKDDYYYDNPYCYESLNTCYRDVEICDKYGKCTTKKESYSCSFMPPRWNAGETLKLHSSERSDCVYGAVNAGQTPIAIHPDTVDYRYPEGHPRNSHQLYYSEDLYGGFEPNCYNSRSCQGISQCGPSPYQAAYGCGFTAWLKYKREYKCYGGNKEVSNTGLSYACGVDWVPVGVTGDNNRHCRAAHFGGEGGNGTKTSERICLMPDAGSAACEVKIPSHSVPSVCTNTQIQQAAKEKGCIAANIQSPVFKYRTDKVNQNNQGDACSAATLIRELAARGICGHLPGQYNCYEYHTGEKQAGCAKWSDAASTIHYTVGKFGEKNTGIGSPSTPIGSIKAGDANNTTISIGGLKNINLKGGTGGAFGEHGVGGDGVTGGRHDGPNGTAGNEHTTDPKINAQDGSAGYIIFTEKWIDVGQGGQGGNFKMGYFRNIKGPVTMTTGAGGSAGLNGEAGTDGGTTTVRAQKGGYSESNDGTDNGHLDNGNTSGVLLEAAGGLGGKHIRRYESCSENNSYEGTKGGLSKLSQYGKGGDGSSIKSTVPGCSPSGGKKGTRGAVIIFY